MKQAIERDLKLPVGLPTTRVAAVTGEAYVTMTSGGVKPEGSMCLAVAFTEEKAWQMFRREVAEYFVRMTRASSEGFYLYWRTEPAIEKFKIYTDGFDEKEEHMAYICRARLLISKEPVRQDLVKETEQDRAA